MRHIIRTSAVVASVVALVATCLVPPAVAQDPPAPAVEEGWTQIDVRQKGIDPVDSPYTRETRTATFTLRLKNAEGEWEEKELTFEMTKGKTFAEMARDFALTQLKPCTDAGWQFSWAYHTNGVSIFGVDAGNDPHTDNPTVYPDEKKNRPNVRVETHKYKK